MKRLVFLSILIFIFLTPTPVRITSFADIKTYYAKVNDGVYFYSSPIKGEQYKMFEIPSSYFVLLLGNANGDFYKAKYSNVEGFVMKTTVTPVEETPNYPYANTSFRIFTETNLYSEPNTNLSITTLPALTDITTFYGKITGDELIPKSTDVWYYCRYKYNENYYTGYVFSYYCDLKNNIVENNELITPISGEIFKEEETLPIQNSSTLTTVLIVICCVVPCLIVVLLLLKKKSSKPLSKKIIKRPKRDYFEFNEDDI